MFAITRISTSRAAGRGASLRFSSASSGRRSGLRSGGHVHSGVGVRRLTTTPGHKANPSGTPSAGKSDAAVPSSGAKASAGSSSFNKGPLSWPSLILLVITGGGLVAYYNYIKQEKRAKSTSTVTTAGQAALGGSWCLVDANGNVVTDVDLRGHFCLIYFGFTFCPDICPSELQKMNKVLTLLDKNPSLPKVIPVFISLDPHRDTVEQMKAYAQDFHPRMLSLTGTPAQVSEAAKKFRVYFSHIDRKEDSDEDYMVDHSIVMYFMDRDGKFLEFFTQLTEAQEVADRITAYLKKA